MNREEYLKKKEQELENLINNSNDAKRLKSENAQLFVLRMGATISQPSYNEHDLWAKAIYLSSKSSLLLQENINNKIALKAMKSAAEIFLNLHYLSTEYDREYSLVLSAICFDIAGYQANASALIHFLGDNLYTVGNRDEISNFSNYFLWIIQLFLTKSLSSIQIQLNSYIKQLRKITENFDKNTKEAFRCFFIGINLLINFLLYGKNNNYVIYLNISRYLFKKTNNVLLYNLIDLFITRCKILNYRCIWNRIEHKNLIWDTYLKLISTDIYSDTSVKPISKRISKFELWISQLRAIEAGLLDSNKSFVIQMPTGTGKTFIAELAILKALTEFPNKKCIYITPFRTLSNEVKETLSKNLNKLNFIVSNVIGSYEIDESQTILIDKSDVIISTPEKIDLLFRTEPKFFENVSIIVIDEGHIVGNNDQRAFLLELLISKLKYKLEPFDTRFIFISAVIPDNSLKNLSLWVTSCENNIIQSNKYLDEKQWQSTNRIIGKVTWYKTKREGKTISSYGKAMIEYPEIKLNDNNKIVWASNVIQAREYKYKKQKKDGTLCTKRKVFPADNKGDISVELAYKYSSEGPVLIFTSLPKYALSLAKKFLEMIELKRSCTFDPRSNYYICDKTIDSYVTAQEWFGEEHIVTKAINFGVGIHYGDMPEAVRKAVERDFRNRKLRILIATSTIAQGVNFPIKTIIIHSLAIHYSKEEQEINFISQRDFLNIIGRAGRPGKEAEGLVLFPVWTRTDERLFKQYCLSSTRSNIYSIIFNILKGRLSGYITEEIFNQYLDEIFSASILDILVEESVETSDEELINNFIGKTLFYIQAQQESIDISDIKQKVKKIKNNFYLHVPDKNLRKLFSMTGFSFLSCLTIKNIIEEQDENLKQYVSNNDYINLIIFICLQLVNIPEMVIDKTEISNVVKEEFFSYFIRKWIECNTIEELRALWFDSHHDLSSESFNLFLEHVFNYKYPWGISVFVNLMIYILRIENKIIIKSLKILPSLLKYGVNNEKIVWLFSLGIQSRATAQKLNNYFLSRNLNNNFTNVLTWFANITFEELDHLDFLNDYEKHDILKISQNITFDKKIFNKYFWVKGIIYSETRKKLSNDISIGDMLEMKRDYQNKYDQFAITLSYKDQILGYVPKAQTKILSLLIDLHKKYYKAEVVKTLKFDTYNKILCSVAIV